MIINEEDLEFREAYIVLHEILSREIKANGFLKEHEAISFLSSYFAHFMHHDFIKRYLSAITMSFELKDYKLLVSEIERILDDVRVGTEIESLDLGITNKFLRSFYDEANRLSRSNFILELENLAIDNPGTVEKMRKKSLTILYNFLSSCVGDAKKTFYRESWWKEDLSIILIWTSFLVIAISLFYSKTNFFFWMRR